MRNIFILIISLLFTLGCKNEHSKKGDIFFKNKDFSNAIKSYTKYLNTEPRDIRTIYNRGRAYEETKQYNLALKDFKKVIKHDPNNINVLQSIALDYYNRLKDYENTIYTTNKIIDIFPTNTNAYILKGKALHHLSKHDEALEVYNIAIKNNKSSADAYLSRATLYLSLKQTSRACDDIEKAKLLGLKDAIKIEKKHCN